MADNLARARLARLAASYAERAAFRFPALVFFTDDTRVPDPLPSICALPSGSMVVLRERNSQKRRALASATSRIARTRRLIWTVADDPALAMMMRAHGVHFPETKLEVVLHWRARRPSWLITCAAHSLAACTRAARCGVDAVFLAPVFATKSHPGRRALGPLRLRRMAQEVLVPVYALGGINAHTAMRLAGAPLAGLGAVDALAAESRGR